MLYRLWADKKAMFIAAIEHVYDASRTAWEDLLAADDEHSAAERLLAYEAAHHGEWGLYRLVFAGLSEVDDPQVRDALGRMYLRYHEFIVRRLAEHRRAGAAGGSGPAVAAELAAWALIGMGTMASIGRELGLLTATQRRRLFDEVGPLLLGRRRR